MLLEPYDWCFVSRVIRALLLQEDPEINCGETHGCFRQCINSKLCEFRVAWQPQSEGVWFDVMVPPLDDLEDQWLALAFSDDHKMVSGVGPGRLS